MNIEKDIKREREIKEEKEIKKKHLRKRYIER